MVWCRVLRESELARCRCFGEENAAAAGEDFMDRPGIVGQYGWPAGGIGGFYVTINPIRTLWHLATARNWDYTSEHIQPWWQSAWVIDVEYVVPEIAGLWSGLGTNVNVWLEDGMIRQSQPNDP